MGGNNPSQRKKKKAKIIFLEGKQKKALQKEALQNQKTPQN